MGQVRQGVGQVRQGGELRGRKKLEAKCEGTGCEKTTFFLH